MGEGPVLFRTCSLFNVLDFKMNLPLKFNIYLPVKFIVQASFGAVNIKKTGELRITQDYDLISIPMIRSMQFLLL